MKRLFVICLMIVCSMSVFAQNKQGQSSVGFNVGYGFDSENATLGIDYRYCITDEFRITPSVTHLVRNDGLKAWSIDLNAHYIVRLNDLFGFYPLGGLSLSFWDAKANIGPWPPHTSLDWTRFGANVGLGGELYATDQITVGLEMKYNIIKKFDQAMLAVRVGYNF